MAKKKRTEPKPVGVWREAPALNHARARCTLVLLPDGRVLARGGRDLNDRALDSSELRDPESGLWRVVPEAMAEELETGGRRAALYDPEPEWPAYDAFDELTKLASPRLDPLRVLLTNGDVLIAGGHEHTISGMYSAGNDVLSTLVFRPEGQPRWQYAGRLRKPRTSASACWLADGRLLVAGGYSMSSEQTFGPTRTAVHGAVETWESVATPPRGGGGSRRARRRDP